MSQASAFTRSLLSWSKKQSRFLPWKEDKDPYKIWISEIILQQTRVAQGTPYYLRFIDQFPDIFTLAKAKEDEVLKIWEGLGYYSRARNLHYTAKEIVDKHQGIFPSEYDEILKLKGIGSYTAAAIASFAFGKSHPVVDGNVIRLVSRYFGIEEDMSKVAGKRAVENHCKIEIENSDPAIFNQAIMDYGSQVCKPQSPNCDSCQMSETCFAFAKAKIKQLPYNSKKIKKRKRHMIFYLIEDGNSIYIERNEGKDIWKGLYQLPRNEIAKEVFKEYDYRTDEYFGGLKYIMESNIIKHVLTHQNLFIRVLHLHGSVKRKELLKVSKSSIRGYAFPIILKNYLYSYLDK